MVAVDVASAFWQGAAIAGFVAWLSFCLASLEMEIEGAHGWAARLPTWKRRSWLCGRRPWTGYHTSLALTMISSCLTGAVSGGTLLAQPTAGPNALFCLSVFVLTMATEDSYWYALNYVFHEAVAKGEATDHFTLAARLGLYLGCSLVALVLWLIGSVAWGRVSQGGATFGVVLLGLVVLHPVVESTLVPLHNAVRRRLDHEALPDSSLWASCRRPLAFVAATAVVADVAVLAAGCWAAAASASRLLLRGGP